ncbi:unnamed protein product [Fraxinus pennsylvanica]|uniref:30S ribosomal protein S17, chloroplastic n=1 Tax=Fraxinus pennsylvanica TaxID=56036 RepID=A0AAD1YUM9_9LAMI|nr:unnamed protein product [Fraxinus pennsylvanica]
MFLTSASIPQIKSFSLTTPFLHGSVPCTHIFKPSPASPPPPPPFLPMIKAMRTLQGKVVCSTNDKTVAVEVVRLAPHPKYKRRVRIKKKYQAHDPLNQFQVGDIVQLEKSMPISKNKSFLAIPVPSRNSRKVKENSPEQELGLPLESEQPVS